MMKKMSLALALTSALLVAPLSWAQSISATTQDPVYQLDDKLVLGRVESVYYSDIPELKAVPFIGKIDTGADTTSMHAENIHVSSSHPDYQNLKDNELLWAIVDDLGGTKAKWDADTFKPYQVKVSFTVPHPYTGKEIQITDDLERVSAIRSRTSKKPILRPTIKMPMTIAGHTVDTEVNLTKRTQFSSPILIGKTYLDNNAWVFAGYDYLQEQPSAKMIGKKETVEVEGVPYKISISTTSRYTNVHALDIKVDKKNNAVSFTLEGENGKRHPMTLPLVRMLKTTKSERPLVYLPVKIDENETQRWLVYLRDRSKFSSQIRLGQDVASQHFVIDTDRENLLGGVEKMFKSALKSKPLVISPEEQVTIDGYTVPAYPTFTVKTPLLRVNGFEVTEKGKDESVTFYLMNDEGKEEKITKPVVKKLKVGSTVRPVVDGDFLFGSKETSMEFALDVLDEDETQPFFVFGHDIAKGGVLLNTRADHLLDARPLFKAGHIEVAEVEGMSFPVKLDTGADVSSINAKDIKRFQKDGKDMVSFTYENDLGMTKAFTREVVDVMRITAKKGEKANERPVVEMHVKLGELEKKIRVNLQDRGRFHYSMILGKNFLKHGAVVSSDTNYIVTQKPDYEK
ncbi:TPA: ATP-dependent zinc protease family protein [Vibrio diabolicus]|uniref:ATP-dependent zinc protease family protein n=1 Tax=Vibrio diabolicus subgroup TaxID=2315253 RepID=UPI000B15FD5D|nr:MULTISPECIES: RimK/LysX family protein [Vibrio diabolicus subgroup]MCR9304498.1 RimK/LysX family protein [Vibrio diabolicus]MCR9425801.1 RimK/LysX family protein [Vibrio diabolicus]MCR9475051.1 RimK/LysX family protein [Vibrio antiquarius]MCS0314982.1 RimK/LysX family protein [Vibrio diabolicus]MCS0367302.1 RimK/LysX family protein [Vibrio diabolicus]